MQTTNLKTQPETSTTPSNQNERCKPCVPPNYPLKRVHQPKEHWPHQANDGTAGMHQNINQLCQDFTMLTVIINIHVLWIRSTMYYNIHGTTTPVRLRKPGAMDSFVIDLRNVVSRRGGRRETPHGALNLSVGLIHNPRTSAPLCIFRTQFASAFEANENGTAPPYHTIC